MLQARAARQSRNDASSSPRVALPQLSLPTLGTRETHTPRTAPGACSSVPGRLTCGSAGACSRASLTSQGSRRAVRSQNDSSIASNSMTLSKELSLASDSEYLVPRSNPSLHGAPFEFAADLFLDAMAKHVGWAQWSPECPGGACLDVLVGHQRARSPTGTMCFAESP